MSYLLLGLVTVLLSSLIWRVRNEVGVELRAIRAERVRAEEHAACCCELERRRRDAAIEVGLRRRKAHREEHRA